MELNIELPSSTEYFFVYTKSNCKYCNKLKELLDNKYVLYTTFNCDQLLESQRDEFLNKIEELANMPWKTFPMVFYNSKFIGGYDSTEKYLSDWDETF